MVAPTEDRPPGLATIAIHAGGYDPTAEALQRRIAALAGGTAAVATASLPGPLIAALQPLMHPGDQVIAARELAWPLPRILALALPGFGWEARLAEIDDLASFERMVSPKTQAILVPAVAPSGHVADIEALARLAKRAAVPLIVDNTLATPALCRPFAFDADIVIYTETGLLSGEAGAGGFIVDGGRFNWLATGGRYPSLTRKRAGRNGDALAEEIGNFAYAAACREFVGEGPPPLDVARIAAGLETLPLRMARHAENARRVAEFLAGHSRVDSVAHPGLAGDRHHALAEKYCPGGAGVVAFTVGGAGPGATALMRGLQLIATGSTPRPARSHITSTGGDRDEAPGSLLLFAGLEGVNDIVADLEQALATL